MKATVFAALIAFVSVAVAQSPAQSFERHGNGDAMDHDFAMGRGGSYGREGGPGRQARQARTEMLEMLDLDSTTTAKIAKMRDEHQKDRIALRAKLATARVEFRAAMRKEPVDEKAALAKQKEMAAVREQLETSALEHRFAVAKLLTPEQRKLLKQHAGGRQRLKEMNDDDEDDQPMKHRRGHPHSGMDRDDE